MKKILLLILFCFSIQLAYSQYPLIGIDSIQRVPMIKLMNDSTLSPIVGDTVRVRGVVMFNPRNHVLSSSGTWKGTFLQDTNSNLTFSGINTRLPNVADSTNTLFFDNMVPGNIVECTGVVAEFGNAATGETQIDLIPVATSIVGFTQPAAPRVVPLSTFASFNGTPNQDWQPITGEQYEGMYVELQNVSAVDVSSFGGGRVSWRIQDATTGDRIPIRDMSAIMRPPFISSTASTPPDPNASVFIQQGKIFTYIRGIIVEVNGGWTGGTNGLSYAIAPLDSTDVGPVAAIPPIITQLRNIPAVPGSTDSVAIAARVEDLDGSITNVTLNYAIGLGSTTFMSKALNMDSVNHYSAKIGPQPDGTFVKFFITAIDNDNNVIAVPDSAATNSFYKVIDGGITNISQLQESVDGAGTSIYRNTFIESNMSIGARIIATPDTRDLGIAVIQDGNGAYSGIMALSGPNNDFDNWKRGDSINITQALVEENFGVTRIRDVSATLVSSNPMFVPTPILVNIDSVINGSANYTEAYESMLMEFNNVFAVDTNADSGTGADFGEWAIHTDSTLTSGLRIDDFSNDIPLSFNSDSISMGQKFGYVRGILTFSFGNWKLLPRNLSDIDGFKTNNVGIEDLKQDLMIGKIYPNPANSQLFVEFETLKTDNIEVVVSDMMGRTIKSYAKELTQGEHRFVLNTFDMPEGIYIFELKTSEFKTAKRFVIQH